MLLMGVAVTKGRRVEESKHVALGLVMVTSEGENEISYRKTNEKEARMQKTPLISLWCQFMCNVIFVVRESSD